MEKRYMEGAKAQDSALVGMKLGGPSDFVKARGVFEVWTTRNGIPVAGLVRADGSKAYRTTAENALTNQMQNIIRDVAWRLAVWNASSPAGGLWTAGPYIGLALNASPITASDTLSTVNGSKEPAPGTNGYTNRVAPTWAAGGTGQANNTASAASWTAATGNLGGGALGQLFTTPAATGTGSAPNTALISFATLNGGPYTVAIGNTLNVTYTWTVS
jgi:hypothetical protein